MLRSRPFSGISDLCARAPPLTEKRLTHAQSICSKWKWGISCKRVALHRLRCLYRQVRAEALSLVQILREKESLQVFTVRTFFPFCPPVPENRCRYLHGRAVAEGLAFTGGMLRLLCTKAVSVRQGRGCTAAEAPAPAHIRHIYTMTKETELRKTPLRTVLTLLAVVWLPHGEHQHPLSLTKCSDTFQTSKCLIRPFPPPPLGQGDLPADPGGSPQPRHDQGGDQHLHTTAIPALHLNLVSHPPSPPLLRAKAKPVLVK